MLACAASNWIAAQSSSNPPGVLSLAASCGGLSWTYKLYSPRPASPEPAVLLLHGAGDIPDNMVAAWEKFGAREGIVLIAPRLPRNDKFEAVAPRVFRCVVEDAKLHTAIDPRRIFVFGNSMGGYLAYDAAMFDSDYFAAVAVTGMIISPDYDSILNQAKRKTPIVFFMGDHDQFSTLAQARRTRDLLVHGGFPLEYHEIKDHDHNYYALSDYINNAAFAFFRSHPLPD
jgi:dipeptidyl aminopeptidase/acylaminoacyl peptidase